MRIGAAISLAFLMLAAGGLAPSDNPEVLVEREAFTAAGAPWVAMVSGGCGMCSGAGGFGPHAEHDALFVFENARVVFIEFNLESGGAEGFEVAPNVTYAKEELARLLDEAPRLPGKVWVVRVSTARVTDASLPESLRGAWVEAGKVQSATDYGVDYARALPNGSVARQSFHGPLANADDPFHKFSDPLHEIGRAMRALGGAAAGGG